MTIPAYVRSKSYREINGDEIVLGHNEAPIGYINPVTWAKRNESPADGEDTKLQFELTARLADLLQTDPQLQEILSRMDANARLNEAWEAERKGKQ